MKNLKQHIYRPFAISVAIGAASVFAALLISAAVVYMMQLPVEICGVFGVISLAFGCMAAGYALGRKKQRQGLKQGFLCGIALFLLCVFGSLIFGSVSAAGFFGRLVACVISGAVGGVIGVNNTNPF
ncbi:MAG: TIGR04086 family membrane protein [Ruminococcaceae bacterium]|nr:TIGR04086 family membrane protein [Oscillospiraceae bacterium]